jgi:hypothetical protein
MFGGTVREEGKDCGQKRNPYTPSRMAADWSIYTRNSNSETRKSWLNAAALGNCRRRGASMTLGFTRKVTTQCLDHKKANPRQERVTSTRKGD